MVKTADSHSKWLKIAIVILIIIGIFFKITNLEAKVYWNDEVFTSLRISGYTEQELKEQLFDGHIVTVEEIQQYQTPNPKKGILGTIIGLAKEEAQLPPLYFVLVKLWVQLFGNSIAITRSLSVVFSLLSLPCLYFLCRELFNSSLVGWMSIALISVSPFFVLYSQAARPYSLWMLTSLLASWLFLKALRHNNKYVWFTYTIAVILGLYTSPSSLFLFLGHGVYLVTVEKFQFNQKIRNYLIFLVVAIIGFAPWMAIIFLRFHQIQGRIGHYSRSFSNGLPELIFNWLRNLTRLFVDFDRLSFPYIYAQENPLLYVLVISIALIIVGYSLYFLCSRTSYRTWLFVLTIIVSPALPLVLADLILGGQRSGASRYFLPSYIGILLSVSYLLATQLNSNFTNIWKQKLWQLFMVFLFTISIFSSAYISPQKFWWNNVGSRYDRNPEIARLINQAKAPLVISDTRWTNIITLSHDLDRKTKFQLVNAQNLDQIPANFSNYFLYQPSKRLTKKLQQRNDYQIQPISKFDDIWLWQLIKK